MIPSILAAAIKNPVLAPSEGQYANVEANPLGGLVARLWWTIVLVGGLALLIFLIWGGVDLLSSEGDQEKYKNAKNKLTHALMGMGLLAASYAIVKLLHAVFGFDILNLVWPTP